MRKLPTTRRWLFVIVAALTLAGGGGFATLAAAADQLPGTIVAVHSGKCLTMPGSAGPVTQQACSPALADRQGFRLTPVTDGYLIVPLSGAGCLGVRAGNAVHLMSACAGGAAQKFAATPAAGGSFTLKNARTGRCIDVSRRSTADGAPITVQTCDERESQRWQLTSSPEAAPSSAPPSSAPPSSPSPAATTPTAASPAPAAGDCVRPSGTSPEVTVTDVNLPVPVTGYGREGDTEPLPMAIAATPVGDSWLAWLGTDGRVYLGRLDCDDHLIGEPTSFAGIDLQDVQADAGGGVLLLTRRGDCHTGPLCGGTASPCNTMHMIRFDTSGRQVWEQQVTNLSEDLGGFDDGARFVWWYQHHGRLASDGTNYAAYFGVAITVRNGTCVDIHEGDRMQVVDGAGALLSGHDSFAVGCSHAWTSRIVWDPRTGHFVTVCATDNGCRIARPNPYRTVAAGTCDGTLFGGDLVLAADKGYWTAWSQGGQVRLEHFTDGPSDTTVTTSAASSHPHLVSYGAGRMLLAWESGSSIRAQVFDAGTGSAAGEPFTIAVRDHDYQAFKAYADGSVAYPAAGTTGNSVKIARVLPTGA